MTPLPVIPAIRPRTRAECEQGERPCPWVSCRHHLYLDRALPGPGDGNRTVMTAIQGADPPDILPDPTALGESCALDIAHRGGHTLEQIAEILGGLSRERIRQIEAFALYRLGLRGRGDDGFDTAPDRPPPKHPRRKRRGRRFTP